MINKYDGRDGRLMIVITPCEPIAVCIDKNTTAAILEGRREDFRELYEVLKSEMERADPHDHSLEMRNTKMIEGRK